MASKDEIYKRINDALKSRGALNPCAVCGQDDKWIHADGFVRLQSLRNPNKPSSGNEGYPLLPIICKNCGNTIFLNLLILGFASPGELELPKDDTGEK